jgi:aminoglycoside phosphotransferase (APT) family kinase protein
MPSPDYGPAGEARLRAFVEALTGGTVTRMERQVRWRPAWFVDVQTPRGPLHLHLRGDREGDVAIFPELKREADVIEVLGRHGIAVPRIHGYCTEPPCIVMDALPGTRDVSQAASDAERRAIAREYIAQVAAMHALPLDGFAAKGLQVPQGAEAIALVGLEAYLPLYQRTRSRPEPMLEFVIGWLRRNVPRQRTRAAFIQFDSGQFLFDDGKLTGLYDFEFSMIGDPMVDLATMRMRDSIEPLGDDMRALFRHYESCAGEAIDDAVVEYHTLMFATLGAMQFTGTVGRPTPGDPHDVYLEFDLALRQVMLHSMSTLTGQPLPVVAPLSEHPGDNAATLAKLADTIARIQTEVPLEAARKDSAAKLIEWMSRADALGGEVCRHDLDDISTLLGQRFNDMPQAEAALEAFVQRAGPDDDLRLFGLFGAVESRRLQLYGPTRIGQSALNVHLPPIR